MDAKDIAALFSNREPIEIDFKNTSHGDDDFRETLFADFGTDKIVIKLASYGVRSFQNTGPRLN